ncbi:hypothetical protein [Kingella potus]|uniref:hypothetical protein n=1 Tax=Kingella potus TaxID=265175 RepID=UPI0011C07192|nr:hypothetical protein [Kingella potus]
MHPHCGRARVWERFAARPRKGRLKTAWDFSDGLSCFAAACPAPIRRGRLKIRPYRGQCSDGPHAV